MILRVPNCCDIYCVLLYLAQTTTTVDADGFERSHSSKYVKIDQYSKPTISGENDDVSNNDELIHSIESINNIVNTNSATTFTNQLATNYNNNIATMNMLDTQHNLATNYSDNSATNDNNMAINYNNDLGTSYNDYMNLNYINDLSTNYTDNFAINYNNDLATDYNDNLATNMNILATEHSTNFNNNLATNYNDNLATNTNILATEPSSTTNYNNLATEQHLATNNNANVNNLNTNDNNILGTNNSATTNRNKLTTDNIGMPKNTLKRKRGRRVHPTTIIQRVDIANFRKAVQEATGGSYPLYPTLPTLHASSGMPSLSGYPRPEPSLQEAFLMRMPQMTPNSNNVLEGSSSKVTKPSLQQTFFMPMPPMASNSNDFLGDSSSQYQGTLESEQHWDISTNSSNFKRARTSYFPTSKLQEQMASNSNDFLGDFSSSQYHGTLESLVWPKNTPNSQLNMAPMMQSPPNLHSAHNHKLKAPIEAESDAVNVGVKTLQDRLTKAAATSMDALVKQVRPVVDLSLFCLAILPSSIDKPLMQIRQGQSVSKTLLDNTILQKMEPNHVIKCLKKWLEEEHIKNSKIFQAKIGDVHSQIRTIFQKNPLIDEETTNSEKQKDKQIENSDEPRAVVLFFYFRLFRKLAGFLEAPFKGEINYNESAKKSEREALLFWLIIVGKQIANEFESSLQTDLLIKNGDQKIKMAQFLDSIDTVKENTDMFKLKMLRRIFAFFIGLWDMAKTHASSYEEQEKHVTNKYIKEHCQNQKSSITFY
uniref:VQ domain-containing protein n=1 Tax=Globodera rostochiensis TaxID=31243 RepID=A0A914ICD9_GLORO